VFLPSGVSKPGGQSVKRVVILGHQATSVGRCGHQDPAALGDDQELFGGAPLIGMSGPDSLSVCRFNICASVERGQPECFPGLTAIHATTLPAAPRRPRGIRASLQLTLSAGIGEADSDADRIETYAGGVSHSLQYLVDAIG
jgi:hypothetical protein